MQNVTHAKIQCQQIQLESQKKLHDVKAVHKIEIEVINDKYNEIIASLKGKMSKEKEELERTKSEEKYKLNSRICQIESDCLSRIEEIRESYEHEQKRNQQKSEKQCNEVIEEKNLCIKTLEDKTQVILDLEGKLFQSQESLNQKIIGEETERKQYRYEINRLEEEI